LLQSENFKKSGLTQKHHDNKTFKNQCCADNLSIYSTLVERINQSLEGCFGLLRIPLFWSRKTDDLHVCSRHLFLEN
jgi:hypothetical protein